VIYNFRIGCWVHFSFKISSLWRSNRAKPKCLTLERGRRERRRPCRAPSVPPLYARTSRHVGVHQSKRCAQAPVLDVGGPWSVPRATPARVGQPHRLGPLGVRAAACRSLSSPYRDLPMIGRLRYHLSSSPHAYESPSFSSVARAHTAPPPAMVAARAPPARWLDSPPTCHLPPIPSTRSSTTSQ
jgi:hypothetical protein